MARGGKRAGAGRKPGTVTKKRNLAQAATESTIKALTEGTTPLDILIGAMQEAYNKGGYMAAAPFAKEAAPYVHPKLSSIEAKVDQRVCDVSADPLSPDDWDKQHAAR